MNYKIVSVFYVKYKILSPVTYTVDKNIKDEPSFWNYGDR